MKGIEPPAVRTAPLADRQLFWLAVSGYVAEAKADELKAGLDRFGNPLVELKPRTIRNRRSAMGPADPNAPPLQPAHGLSRTRSLFTAETTDAADGVVCYWAFDSHTGDSWGEILAYHRDGAGALPVRDVFGLSPQSLGVVKRRAADWWRGYVLGGGANIGPNPIPTGIPPTRFKARGSGWQKRIGRTGGVSTRINTHGRHYDIQGGLGVGRPPAPTGFPSYIPKPPSFH